jgi:hypothetical protein
MAKDSALVRSDRCHHFYHLYIVYIHWRRRHMEPTQGCTTITSKGLSASLHFRALSYWIDNRLVVGRIGRIDKFWIYDNPYTYSCLLWECSDTFLHIFPAQCTVYFVLVLAQKVGIARIGWHDKKYKWINDLPPIILGCYADGKITSSVPASNSTFPAKNDLPTGTAD